MSLITLFTDSPIEAIAQVDPDNTGITINRDVDGDIINLEITYNLAVYRQTLTLNAQKKPIAISRFIFNRNVS